ncbi:MAG: hypothetical protein Q4G28_02525 [Neisseria sp.]|nr:hypothetical protein [Neisseria sp.]
MKTHLKSNNLTLEKWIPACAGMTDGMDISKKKVFCKGLGLMFLQNTFLSHPRRRVSSLKQRFSSNWPALKIYNPMIHIGFLESGK